MVSNPSKGMRIESISRFYSLPLINSAINFATDGYSRFKSYNGLISATLSKAEQSILYMASTAQPVIQKFERPISIADNIACQGLDKLEKTVPALTKSTEEIKDETKKLLSGSVNRMQVMRKYSTDKIQGIKDYGYTKVNGVFDSPYIKAFLKSIDTAIELSNNAVDHYLPATTNEPQIDEQQQQTIVVRMSHLSDKLRRRIHNQLYSKWIPTVVHTINNLKLNVFDWLQNSRTPHTKAN